MLLVALLALAACDDDTTAVTAPHDLAVADLAAPVCATTCAPACTSPMTCVAQASSSFPFSATCLTPCQSDVDCDATRACVDITDAAPAGRYCITRDEPLACGAHCDLVPTTSLCDGANLGTSYAGVVCGVSYRHCANGCVESNPDGGSDRQARCLCCARSPSRSPSRSPAARRRTRAARPTWRSAR